MFTKLKQNIENWLKRLIRDEVSTIETDLQCEKLALRAQVTVLEEAFKANLAAFNTAVERITEVSYHSQENTKLRATVKEMDLERRPREECT